jgi:4-amino-4-deoxy-L-arabinose transferase-like glycosyltransferase
MKSHATRIIAQNWQAISICLLIVLVAGAVWVWGFNSHYFNRRDAYDYAQLSRQVYLGDGLSTLQIFPRHIAYFQERGLLDAGHWPNLYRNPLVTITSAAFHPFFDSLVVAMVIQSGFWYLLSIPVLFFLATELTNLKVATLSTVFLVADPVVFLYSYSGMTETLATFLLLSFFAVALVGQPRTWRWPFLGLVSVLAYLARTQFIILIPLGLLLVWINSPKGKRTSSLLLFAVGLLLLLIPWSLRNLQVAGDPLFSFTTTRNLVLDAVPGHSDLEMQLHAPVDLSTVLSTYGGAIAAKLFRNMVANFLSPLYWANTFRRMFILLPLFAFVGFFGPFDRAQKRYNLLKWSTLGLIVATFAVISLTVYSVRSYVMFRPLLLIVGGYALLGLLDRTFQPGGLRSLLYGLLILVAGYQLASAALDHKNSLPPFSQFDQRSYEFITRQTGEDALIASDISEQISLFAGRRTLRLPAEPAELLSIDRDYIAVDFVLLSKDLSSGGSIEDDDPGYHETYQDYVAFTSSPEFLERYRLEEHLPNGSVLYQRNSFETSP